MKTIVAISVVVEVGDIMYNPKYNGFHQIKEIKESTVILSGCSDYLNDAKTNICRKEVRIDYLTRLEPVCGIHNFMVYKELEGGEPSPIQRVKNGF